MSTLSRTLWLLALAPALALAQGEKKVDPVSGEPVEKKEPPPADAKPAEAKGESKPPEKKDQKAAEPTAAPQKVSQKLFDEALNDYFTGHPKDAAPKLFAYTENVPSTDENYAWAQFFLAKSLLDLKLQPRRRGVPGAHRPRAHQPAGAAQGAGGAADS